MSVVAAANLSTSTNGFYQEDTMGTRNRSAEKKIHQKLLSTLKANKRNFSRRKAENLLRAGADPNTKVKDDKGQEQGLFTDHQNYHVRRLAFMKMGMPMPEDEKVRADLLKSLHVKEATFAQEKEQELTAALDTPATE
jgi:hypothetical protein